MLVVAPNEVTADVTPAEDDPKTLVSGLTPPTKQIHKRFRKTQFSAKQARELFENLRAMIRGEPRVLSMHVVEIEQEFETVVDVSNEWEPAVTRSEPNTFNAAATPTGNRGNMAGPARGGTGFMTGAAGSSASAGRMASASATGASTPVTASSSGNKLLIKKRPGAGTGTGLVSSSPAVTGSTSAGGRTPQVITIGDEQGSSSVVSFGNTASSASTPLSQFEVRAADGGDVSLPSLPNLLRGPEASPIVMPGISLSSGIGFDYLEASPSRSGGAAAAASAGFGAPAARSHQPGFLVSPVQSPPVTARAGDIGGLAGVRHASPMPTQTSVHMSPMVGAGLGVAASGEVGRSRTPVPAFTVGPSPAAAGVSAMSSSVMHSGVADMDVSASTASEPVAMSSTAAEAPSIDPGNSSDFDVLGYPCRATALMVRVCLYSLWSI